MLPPRDAIFSSLPSLARFHFRQTPAQKSLLRFIGNQRQRAPISRACL
jgi:hypothetical protein